MRTRWRLLLLDLIFFIYNLAYPALLGSFFYAVFFVAPNPEEVPHPSWAAFGQILVIAIFSLDFVWGRKFYEWIQNSWSGAKPTTWSLLVFVCAEAVTLYSLCSAFKASASSSPQYYWSIARFALAVLIMFYFQDQKNLWGIPGRILCVLLSGCIAVATLVEWSGNLMFFRAGLFVLAAILVAYYFCSSDKRWQVRVMSPSGSFIDKVL